MNREHWQQRGVRYLTWVVVGLCVAYTAGALAIYPSLFPDPAYGLLVQKSMRAGAAWNFYTEPMPSDIARDTSYFFTVWSPGQHVVPAILQWPGLTLGQALSAGNILSALVGLAGWFALFRALQMDRITALLACTAIAASRTFSFSFLAYVGSDQLAFATFPYLARAIYAVRTNWVLVLIAPVALLAGFFFKNSMAIYVSAWIAAAALAGQWCQARGSRSLPLLAAVGVTVGGALWFIDWAYISRGWTPVTYEPSLTGNPAAYLLPTVMPMLASTGIDDLLSRAFDHPGSARFDYKNSLLILVPLSALAVTWAIAEFRQQGRRETRLIVLGFTAMVTAAFTVLYATGSGASLNLSRHYMIPGALLLPLLFERVLASRSRWLPVLVMLGLAVPAVYGMASFGANWRRHWQQRGSHSDRVGIAHMTMTPRVVQHLVTLDTALPAGSLVVVPMPSLALEFSRTRAMATSATSDGLAQFQHVAWRGRVANIVVIAELNGQTPEEIRAWLATYSGYDPSRWHRATLDGYSFFVPDGQVVDVPWLEATLTGMASDAW